VSRRLALRAGLFAGAGLVGLATGPLSLPRVAAAGFTAKQRGWAWCGKCRGMFFEDNGTLGRCPGGDGHDRSVSLHYWHWYWVGSGIVEDTFDRQQNWRWCSKCQGMAYRGNGPGVCPAGGGHDLSTSFNYAMYHGHPGDPVYQDGWQWCNKCEGLFYGWQQLVSRCPAGGQHDATTRYSFVYAVGNDG
jgi:hypothetical protein